MSQDNGGRAWRDTTKNTQNCGRSPEVRRDEQQSSPGISGHLALLTPWFQMSDTYSYEKNNSWCFEQSSWWHFIKMKVKTNTGTSNTSFKKTDNHALCLDTWSKIETFIHSVVNKCCTFIVVLDEDISKNICQASFVFHTSYWCRGMETSKVDNMFNFISTWKHKKVWMISEIPRLLWSINKVPPFEWGLPGVMHILKIGCFTSNTSWFLRSGDKKGVIPLPPLFLSLSLSHHSVPHSLPFFPPITRLGKAELPSAVPAGATI